MSIYKGTELLAGVATNTVSNAHSLFDFIWSDHIKNEMSWVNANYFSWLDGSLYVAAYNHILADYSGGTSQTETVGSYTITYVLADDGHKITTDETTVANIYAESGVAWYYILDTANTRFKLPRVNPAREELLQVVRAKGSGTALGLTDGTNNGGTYRSPMTSLSGSATILLSKGDYGNNIGETVSAQDRTFDANLKTMGITPDSTKSGIISSMTDSTSVYKGKKYLYFYVGQFSQSATEQTAGLNSELFNGKADTDLNNVSSGIDFVVESYQNGTEWYRLYKSGWLEQGGRTTGVNSSSSTSYSVTFLKEFADTNYNVTTLSLQRYNASNPSSLYISTRTTTGFSGSAIGSNPDGIDWEVKGMSS